MKSEQWRESFEQKSLVLGTNHEVHHIMYIRAVFVFLGDTSFRKHRAPRDGVIRLFEFTWPKVSCPETCCVETISTFVAFKIKKIDFSFFFVFCFISK